MATPLTPPAENISPRVSVAEIFAREPAEKSVLVVDGYGVTAKVRGGQLILEDGVGATRRTRTINRASRTVKRIVVLADTGELTLDAVRWCTDVGITIIQIDRDARPLLIAGPEGRDDARIRRAQAAAATTTAGLAVARQLLAVKIRGQARVLTQHLGLQNAPDALEAIAAEISAAPDLPRCQELEAKAANLYFGCWNGRVQPKWAARDADRIPDHWRTFTSRATPLLTGKTARNAADPINALLNYGYTIAAVEARIAALTLGLDPGLGILHTDKKNRDSFALDLVETIRPDVDAAVLDLLTARHLRKSDFHETRDGRCRLLAPLTHELAEHAPRWARALAPHAEGAGHTLIASADGVIRQATPLTGRNIRAAQAVTDTARSQRRTDQLHRPAPTCSICGTALPSSRRKICDSCWPVHRRQLATDRAAAARRAAAEQPDSERAAATPEAVARKRAGHLADREARDAWEASGSRATITAQELDERVLPLLAQVSLGRIRTATGLSVSACSRIRSRVLAPHERHWDALAALVDEGALG